MKAIGVEKYGSIEELRSLEISKPDKPLGHDLLIRVAATSVNPIDIKVRKGEYDDAPDYYEHVPKPFHIISMDGSGTVIDVGPQCTRFKPGDDVFYVGATTRQGAAAEFQLVDERDVGHKPKSLDFVEAAAMPLTYGTAYESLVERLEIKKGENVGLLIINGAGGVGAVASQIGRWVLELPVIITTASRPETIEFTKKMGATHVIDHRKDLKQQVDDLNLDVPIKYIFILHRTEQYINVCSEIAAPFGKICSIVQAHFDMYGTKFLSKSLTFAWAWLGTRPFHHIEREAHYIMLEELSGYIDAGKIRCHLTQRLKLTLDGLKKAHEMIESGKCIGKIALGVSEGGPGDAFS